MRNKVDRPHESSGRLQRAALVQEHALNKIMAEVTMHRSSVQQSDFSVTESDVEQLPSELNFDPKRSAAVERYLDSKNLMELIESDAQDV